MPRRVAVIDLGTNTFNLLIADVSGNTFKRVLSEEIPVKLGEGGINAGIITPEAWQRGFKAIKYIREKTTEYHCSKIMAVATSAIRSASNGVEFKQAVLTETGIDIEVIDGNLEAQLIYEGVRKGVRLENMSLIMDIGGGSVEFIICDANQVFWKESFPVGAARLKEKFHHSDPVNQADQELLKKHLDDTLGELYRQCAIYKPQNLIGSAGAFETFAELVSMKFHHVYDKEGGEFIFELKEFLEVTSKIIKSDHSARKNMPGLVPFRVDMIVSATMLTLHILERTGMRSLKLSAYALKEGVLVREMSN